ncbi:MAG: hypothetical protein ACKVS6_02795 [Planctomycetota bacterium]
MIASRLSPLPGTHRYQFAIPRGAVKNGILNIVFEPAGLLPIVAIAEIRVQQGSDPLAHEKTLYTRICPAGWSSVGTRVFARDSHSRFVKHLEADNKGVICTSGDVLMRPGDYEVRVYLRQLVSSNDPLARLRVGAKEKSVLTEIDVLPRNELVKKLTAVKLPFKVTGETSTTINVEWRSTGLVEFEAVDLEIHVVR